ncbi:hypothetical protein GCM10025868_25730 [Angustibacter aerolatus]|uniref:Uncharacterized protein n=1 Tax=Angustibacter aerolatus TaxID=1162965 RepID=A0ABQ6JGL0_9ACTN|nr:hypothetical protein GCM10025868_25730 [Angustibacter aerolatus]
MFAGHMTVTLVDVRPLGRQDDAAAVQRTADPSVGCTCSVTARPPRTERVPLMLPLGRVSTTPPCTTSRYPESAVFQ